MWKQFRGGISEELHNSAGTSEEIEEMLDTYRKKIHDRFERPECGKETIDGETRCLHHIISPLAYDNTTHEFDFMNIDHLIQPLVCVIVHQ